MYGTAGEQAVTLDRAGIPVFRDIAFLAAGPQVNAVVRPWSEKDFRG
jgi:hypothetical protein